MVLFCLWNCFQNQFNYQVIHLIQYREGSQIFWLICLKRKLSFCAKPFPRCYSLPMTTASFCEIQDLQTPSLGWVMGSAALIAVAPHRNKKKKKIPPVLPWETKLTIAIVSLQKWSFYKELGVSENLLGFRSIISYDGTFKYIAWISHALIQIQPFLSFPLNSTIRRTSNKSL